MISMLLLRKESNILIVFHSNLAISEIWKCEKIINVTEDLHKINIQKQIGLIIGVLSKSILSAFFGVFTVCIFSAGPLLTHMSRCIRQMKLSCNYKSLFLGVRAFLFIRLVWAIQLTVQGIFKCSIHYSNKNNANIFLGWQIVFKWLLYCFPSFLLGNIKIIIMSVRLSVPQRLSHIWLDFD